MSILIVGLVKDIVKDIENRDECLVNCTQDRLYYGQILSWLLYLINYWIINFGTIVLF